MTRSDRIKDKLTATFVRVAHFGAKKALDSAFSLEEVGQRLEAKVDAFAAWVAAKVPE